MFSNVNRQPPVNTYLRERFVGYYLDSEYNYTYKESTLMCRPDKPLVLVSPPGEIERLLQTQRYADAINNTDSAAGLNSVNIDSMKLVDSWDQALESFSPSLEEQELTHMFNNEAFLRVNTKDKIVYTVKRSGDWYIFKSFIPGMWTTREHIGESQVRVVKNNTLLKECSQWCVKQLPSLDLFNNIRPYVTTMEEVIQMDPSFRYYEEDEIRYSTHTFADPKGTCISIRYKKDKDGVFRIVNFNKAWEGFNVLPYLLPVDRQLIDPGYTPPEETEESEEVKGAKGGCCNIM